MRRVGVAAGLLILCCAALGIGGAHANAGHKDAILFADRDVFPESMTRSRSGWLIAGSLSQPFIYRARANSHYAERWIDLRPLGSTSYGVLADDARGVLWVCTLYSPNIGGRPPAIAGRRTALRSFDLRTGVLKRSWDLPEATRSGRHSRPHEASVCGPH